MKEIIISKQNKMLDLNRMITHFSNFKNTFTPLQKETRLILIKPSSSSLKENVKRKKMNHELSETKLGIVKSSKTE